MTAAALVLALAGALELRRAAALAGVCTGLGLPARRALLGWRRSGLAGVGMLVGAVLLLVLGQLGGL
jgi:hypothetical protein